LTLELRNIGDNVATYMSLAKSLTAEQIATIQSWADEGDGLSEIQSKLGSEFEAKVTYLETRFLLEDIGVELKKEPEPEPEPEVEEEAEEADPTEDGDAPELSGDEVDVSIDKLVRPEALISGKVRFAGGHSAGWWLDQAGQLGMDPKDEAFNPSPEQMMAFQRQLQEKIQQSGL